MKTKLTFYREDPHLLLRLIAANVSDKTIEFIESLPVDTAHHFQSLPDLFGDSAGITILPGKGSSDD